MKKVDLLLLTLVLVILAGGLDAQQQLVKPAPSAGTNGRNTMQVERLDRGLVAVRTGPDSVYLGWRLFGKDPEDIAFNIYRNGHKVNVRPITGATNYVDVTKENGSYTITSVSGKHALQETKPVFAWAQNYLEIPLQKPAGSVTPDGVTYTYNANDCSVGDLDGDGEYEIVLKWDPSNAKDNSHSGYTGPVYLDAYKMNGKRLWRINLGPNIRAGAHYTQFMVYDLDGDGKAEVACKTADGTVDGKGVVIGDGNADYRNSRGYVIEGPEFLTIFNGVSGRAMATTAYLPGRGDVSAWGDSHGNRVDRFIAAVAYLDGERPSLVMGRGYYTRLVRAAWDWRDGRLSLRWIFDSDSTGNSAYRGDGNHQMTVGDVDGDGKQEVINGSSVIDDNGAGLWTNEMGHGDALHMSDMDPDRPGLEIWQCYEGPKGNGGVGAALVDARTGDRVFTVAEPTIDVGRALAADIDPRYKGYEMWAAKGNLYSAKGEEIGVVKPSVNFAIWWDGDLSRELLDGTTISKWDYQNSVAIPILATTGTASNNGTKSTPALSADILGDWREEVIFRTADNSSLRIYTTTIPTGHRIYTLMHDPQYRVAVAWQNAAYNQPPHPGFYLGTDMHPVPKPRIVYAGEKSAPRGDGKVRFNSIKIDAPFEMPLLQVPDFSSCPVFSVIDFGAEKGNKDKTTKAIAQAVAAAADNGGGVVLVPEGEWLTGKIHLASNVNLHLVKGAVLIFSGDPADYLPAVHSSWEGLECYNYSPLIYAYQCKNVAITGEGEVKAQMEIWKQWFARPKSHMESIKWLYNQAWKDDDVIKRQMVNDTAHLRPQFIQFNRCENVLLEGITITNSPFWTIHPYLSKNVVIRKLKVFAHGHNNDGVDPEMSTNVLIERCVFDQGDDAIAIKSGRAPEGWRLKAPCQNIIIRNCSVKNGHQLVAIGSELSGGIENVLIDSCQVADGAKLGHLLFIKTNERMGGYVRNIYARNIKAGKVDLGILGIETDVLYQWRTLVPTYEKRLTPIKNVFLENVAVSEAKFVSRIIGNPELPVENVSLKNTVADKIHDKKHVHENVKVFYIDSSY